MHGEPARIGSFAKRLELRLHPCQSLREQYRRFLRNRATVLLQFGAQGPDRTAAARQPLTVFNLYLYEPAQPLCRRICFVQLLQQSPESRNAEVDNGIANLVLGFEVVVDVAEGNPSLLRDVRDRRAAAPIP